MRTLLVEDNSAQRDLMLQLLQPFTDEAVAAVPSQDEAIDWLQRHDGRWDLVLVDLFLAQGNGFGILKMTAGRTPRQKVVLMSNYAQAPVRQRALEEGADLFIDKGLDLGVLLTFCRDLQRVEPAPQRAPAPADARKVDD